MIDENPLIALGRTAASEALKGADILLRGGSFTRGHGRFIVGGMVMQFDYQRLFHNVESKITELEIDDADGSDINNRGLKPQTAEFMCWYSGPLKDQYKQLVLELNRSRKAQIMITRDVSFRSTIRKIEFTHSSPNEIKWRLSLIEVTKFSAFNPKKDVLSRVLDVVATQTTRIEDLF